MSTTELASGHANGHTAATRRPSIPSRRISHEQLVGLAARVQAAPGAESIEVEQPFTGGPLGAVPRCREQDVRERRGSALAALRPRWRATSFAERKQIFLRYHDMVLERREELLDLIQLETGKARRHAFEELLDAAIVARYYANTAEGHLRTHRRRGALPLLTATWEYRHPLGVVGVIAPWNYPLTLSISDALPALAAGNGVVIKPDSQTPFTALWGASLLEQAGLPEGLLQVVTGSGSELGPTLIDAVDYMMFTGSTATGRTVAERAGRQLIGASMELGGKNAMIVLEDASLARAVDGAERALFSNSGQLCISIERLFVHEAIADEFTRRLVERTRSMRLGELARLRRGHGLADLADPARDGARARRRRRSQGRARARRRACPPRPRPVLLRADAARGHDGRDDAVRERDLRSGRGGLSLLLGGRRGGRGRTRASTGSTSASGPGTRAADAASRPASRRAPSTSTRATWPRGRRWMPRWAG